MGEGCRGKVVVGGGQRSAPLFVPLWNRGGTNHPLFLLLRSCDHHLSAPPPPHSSPSTQHPIFFSSSSLRHLLLLFLSLFFPTWADETTSLHPSICPSIHPSIYPSTSTRGDVVQPGLVGGVTEVLAPPVPAGPIRASPSLEDGVQLR